MAALGHTASHTFELSRDEPYRICWVRQLCCITLLRACLLCATRGARGECECECEHECECRARDYSRNDNEQRRQQQQQLLSFGVGFKGERSLCNNKLRDNGDDNGASVCCPEGARAGGMTQMRLPESLLSRNICSVASDSRNLDQQPAGAKTGGNPEQGLGRAPERSLNKAATTTAAAAATRRN